MDSVKKIAFLLILAGASFSFAQTESAYDNSSDTEKKGFFDPSRFSIHHAATFGMSSSQAVSGLQSQSLYFTMMQYQFSKPVTLNLNFGLPIHSTYNSAMNLNSDNIQSADYFRNMPFNASLTWQPSDNMQMKLTVAREPYGPGLFYSDPFDGYSMMRPYHVMNAEISDKK
jgi:hypothetical protein